MGITPRTTFFVGLPLAEQPYYLALSAPSSSIVLTAAEQLLPLSSNSLVASPSAQLQEHPDLNKRKPLLSDSLQSTSTKSTAKPTTAQVAWLQPSLPSTFHCLTTPYKMLSTDQFPLRLKRVENNELTHVPKSPPYKSFCAARHRLQARHRLHARRHPPVHHQGDCSYSVAASELSQPG